VKNRSLSRTVPSLLAAVLLAALSPTTETRAQKTSGGWKAGVARAVITPEKPTWMAGYASRTKPSEGKLHDLYAKALALEDDRRNRVVIVTSDLLGLSRELSEAVATEALRRYKLRREQLMLTSSHTHTGPVLKQSLRGAYDLNAAQTAAVVEYTDGLQQRLVAVIGDALKDLSPARLAFGRGEAHFGVNRREMTPRGINFGVDRNGPADSDVPVLRVESPQGSLRAALFSYACHNTTMTGEHYLLSGDYAGFACAAVEQAHPGAAAMFMSGCGADINPYPRGTVELAREHGAALAKTVNQVLGGRMQGVHGRVKTAFDHVKLPFAPPPTKEEFQSRLSDSNVFRRRHAERMIARLERDGKLISEYSYPIQVFQLGEGPTLVALAGEVAVDYARRLKRELGVEGMWVVGYANDVFAYVPTVRILNEGGYEADFSMIYYDLPGRFAPTVEDTIINKVHELTRRVGRKVNKAAAQP
jgi:neutral ceramidase